MCNFTKYQHQVTLVHSMTDEKDMYDYMNPHDSSLMDIAIIEDKNNIPAPNANVRESSYAPR